MDEQTAEKESPTLGKLLVEDITLRAYNEFNNFKRISPALLQRRYGINEECAYKICCKIWLLRNIEARNMAKGIEV